VRTSSRLLFPSILVGIGGSALVDEIVFHQLLHWHHLYDRSTHGAALTSDGILSIVCNSLLVAGLVLLWRRRAEAAPGAARTIVGGIVAGFGGFNLFDGTVDHKLLRLHQIREGVHDLLPYDVTWIAASALILAVGVAVILGRARRPHRLARETPAGARRVRRPRRFSPF
jgi:uncharacterized membrane protein